MFCHFKVTLAFFLSCRRSRKQITANQRHNSRVETPINLYLGLRLFKNRDKGVIEVMNHLQLCPSYDRLKVLANQMGNLTIDTFERHQVAVGHNFTTNQFTTGGADNIDHNPSSTTAYGSFHGLGITLTQHPNISSEGGDAISHSRISKDTPKALKDLPRFYTTLSTPIDENMIHPDLPPMTNFIFLNFVQMKCRCL